jgi:cytochrome b subunit of formate dehydrogenase
VDIVRVREDIWGREVFLGISWDLLWVVVIGAFAVIIAHLIVMAMLKSRARPSPAGKRLARHAGLDRAFHWVTAVSVFVLLFTGVLPILGVKFGWLTAHWIAGLVLTAAVLLHTVRSLVWQDAMSMWIAPKDLREPFDDTLKPGKYSLAQKGMHMGMAVLVLAVCATGIVLLLLIDTPWWNRGNWLNEATLGWMFLLHGASTLGLIGLTALHMYFAFRPEKIFYTRSMLSGWISEDEHAANHDAGRWLPDETAG